ncbi:MAG: hypothetical protein HC905_19430 [Bacteroidales bacterium]|nr:hypothetical protein [Bacteroidales bacterium]
MKLTLPAGWKDYDVLFISAIDPHGRNINNWTWNISLPAHFAQRNVNTKGVMADVISEKDKLIVKSGDYSYSFDKNTGYLSGVTASGKTLSLGNGPAFAGWNAKFKELLYYQEGQNTIIEAVYEEKNKCGMKWTILANGWIQLDYNYRPYGTSDYWGITFKYPETLVTGASLLANGPYRVWKNRTRGPLFGLHTKPYNNTVTGESWEYPEFKGYYSNFYAVEIQTKELPFKILSASEDLYLHLFTPQSPKHAAGSVTPPFPDGDISILHAISPIGTKFSKPETSGPQGWKNEYFPNPSTEIMSARLFLNLESSIWYNGQGLT